MPSHERCGSDNTRLSLFVLHFLLALASRLDGDQERIGIRKSTLETDQGTPSISVVLLTIYRNSFVRIIRHYEGMPFVTDILVVWNNVDIGPPWVNGSFRVPVTVVLENRNTLNNRYTHAKMLKNHVALLTDDDVLLDSNSLKFAMGFIKRNPMIVVGFFPRRVVQEENVWKYGGVDGNVDVFHMTTGRAHLIHTRWMDAFTALPAEVLAFIDKSRPTCEDITLHFLIGNTSSSQVICIEPCKSVILRARGMSKRARHWRAKRSACLNRLLRVFGGMMLRNNTNKFSCLTDFMENKHDLHFNAAHTV